MKNFKSWKLSVVLAATACVSALMMTVPTLASPQQTTRISGIGYFDEFDLCDSGSVGADFALIMTGDLTGCLYVFIESATYTPSGTYMETGREVFVGANGGFVTEYRFEAKYEDPANLLGEIVGRCQHKIVESSGTGVFEGAGGRIDFKDDIEAGNFPYRGTLKPAN